MDGVPVRSKELAGRRGGGAIARAFEGGRDILELCIPTTGGVGVRDARSWAAVQKILWRDHGWVVYGLHSLAEDEACREVWGEV